MYLALTLAVISWLKVEAPKQVHILLSEFTHANFRHRHQVKSICSTARGWAIRLKVESSNEMYVLSSEGPYTITAIKMRYEAFSLKFRISYQLQGPGY